MTFTDPAAEMTMRSRVVSMVWGLLGFLAISSAPQIRAEEASLATACPLAAAWNDAHADQLPAAMKERDQRRTLSKPEVRKELERRFDIDQEARTAFLVHHQNGNEIGRIDDDNERWLIGILKESGWPTVDQIGEFGLHLMWLLVQHADRRVDLQKVVLPFFERMHTAGVFSSDDLARLSDRILVHEEKPQRYGTQIDWSSSNFELRNIENVEEVEANRAQIGLMPLKDYGCMRSFELKQVTR